MSPLPVLYSFRRCPYAIRARLAIAYAGLQVEIREVVLKDKPQALLAICPQATVPVLQLGNGEIMSESLDIMRWALAQNDPEKWLVQDEAIKNHSQSLLRLNDGEFKYWLDRYKYHDRHPANSQQSYREEAERFLVQLEEQLTKHAWLTGQTAGLADIAIFPFIRQFALVDYSWFSQSPYQHLLSWLENLLSSPLFNLVMPKLPPWKEGDKPTVFPPLNG